MVKEFIENDSLPWEEVEEGVQRKVIAYDSRLMLVKVKFTSGGVGSVHSHPHSQITHVESGVFEVSIGADIRVLRAGDAYYAPPDVLHGARCLEDGILIDVFSPMREDFLPSKRIL